jgi:hypothetical protein
MVPEPFHVILAGVAGNNIPWNKCPGARDYVVMILNYGHWLLWPST